MQSSKKSLAVLLAALVVAGTGVAKAALLQTAQPSGAPAAAPNAAGHRIVFDKGHARYEGEALRTSSLAAHLTEAKQQRASARSALEGRMLDSLVSAGLPPEIADLLGNGQRQDPKVGPWLSPAGDLDGDGKDDVLAQTVRWYEDGQDVLQVAGVSGTDGTVLWDRTFRGAQAAAVPARVGHGAGALVFSYDVGPTGADAVLAWAGSVDVTLNIAALDAAGALAWTRQFSGSWQAAEAYAFVVYGFAVNINQLPYLVGTLDGDGDGVTDVVVAADTTAYACAVTCAAGPMTSEAHMVRGSAPDLVTGPMKRQSADGEPVAFIGPDLAGRGRGTVLFATDELSGGGIDAFDPSSSTRLWAKTGLPSTYFADIVPVGDIDGDGGADLVAWSPYNVYEGIPTPLLRGADGELLWARYLGFPYALGHGAVGSITGAYDPATGDEGISYSAFDADGQEVYNTSYLVPYDYNAPSRISVYPNVGDLDGDGFSDSAHNMVAADYDTETFVRESGAVSGRTGGKLWNGPPGPGLPGGPGLRDMATVSFTAGAVKVTRIAGSSGVARWTATVPGHSLADLFGHDVTGDGVADVVVNAAFYLEGDDYEAYASRDGEPVVLNGATGQALWTLSDLPEGSKRPRTETKAYIAPPPLLTGALMGCPDDTSASGNCFNIDPTDQQVAASIHDDHVASVAGLYRFVHGNVLYSEGYFCDSADLAVPPGAAELYVFALDANAGGLEACPDAQPATTGTITARFS